MFRQKQAEKTILVNNEETLKKAKSYIKNRIKNKILQSCVAEWRRTAGARSDHTHGDKIQSKEGLFKWEKL